MLGHRRTCRLFMSGLVILLSSLGEAQEPAKLLLLPELSQGLYIYENHPSRDLASATTARLSTWMFERYLLSATYRFTYLNGRGSVSAPWLQQDVYAQAAYAVQRFGLSLHYAMVHGALNASTDYAETSHHIGVSARYSEYGDGVFLFAASFYAANPVLRGELGWRIPVLAGFSARPAFALQWSPEGLRPSGSLTVRYDHTRFALFLGGKIGDEKRPAYLAYEFIYNGLDRILYGVWAGASGRLGAGFAATLSYALDRLATTVTSTQSSASTEIQSSVHYLTLGVTKEFSK